MRTGGGRVCWGGGGNVEVPEVARLRFRRRKEDAERRSGARHARSGQEGAARTMIETPWDDALPSRHECIIN